MLEDLKILISIPLDSLNPKRHRELFSVGILYLQISDKRIAYILIFLLKNLDSNYYYYYYIYISKYRECSVLLRLIEYSIQPELKNILNEFILYRYY